MLYLLVLLAIPHQLLRVQPWLLQESRPLLFQLLGRLGQLVRRAANQGVVEGLLVEREVVASVRVDVVCFEVVAVDDAVGLAANIVPPVVLEALSVEVLSEGSVRQVP